MNLSTVVNALILAVVLGIVTSLAMGLYYLLQDRGRTKRTVRALTWRIVLSLMLFAALMIGFLSGWIQMRSPFERIQSQTIDKDKQQ